jgi:DNA-binding transcriptional LysR family regulator
VEPTEAGRILYRGAQRLLHAEGQLIDELSREASGELHGTLAIGASTGPGAHLVPLMLCRFRQQHRAVVVSLSIFDTQSVINHVVQRELELGVVGALRRHRALTYERLALDEIVLAVPPEHRFDGREVSLEELSSETNIVMQEGAGVRQVVEEELRGVGIRLRDLPGGLELGLQESVKSAVAAGYGVAFISRTAIEGELAGGTLGVARVAGLKAKRPIYAVRASGRALSRAAEAFLDFARPPV